MDQQQSPQRAEAETEVGRTSSATLKATADDVQTSTDRMESQPPVEHEINELSLAIPPSPRGPSSCEEPTDTAQAMPGSDGELLRAADTAPVESDTSSGDLEELILPSLIQAPEPLPPGTPLGPQERLRVAELVQTRGRINQYAATWRQEDQSGIEVELREGPTDDTGLQCEAEVLTAVQYTMLPHFYQAWEENGRRYLALERLQGQPLEQALAVNMPTGEALSLILQLVQVVRRVHQAGWALLGLAPADIVLGQPLHLVRLRHAGRIGERQTQSLQVAGYSAPELACGATVSGKEDVYTLGALLYHALAGYPLPEGGAASVDLSATVRLPGGPQVLADALAPADERIDIDALYQRLLSLKLRHAETALSLEVTSATTLGLNPTRHVNEDTCAFALWSQAGADGTVDVALLCVADGMGGMEAGEIASQTAVNVVMRGADSMFWPAASDAARGAGRRLDPVRLIRDAATAVHAAAQGRELGTTATVVAVHGSKLTLGHVGDTRAYLFREGSLTQLTADHSLVAAMVASGILTREEAQGHPDSNKVLRSLGSQRELPDGYVDDLGAAYGSPILILEENDWLILCSDGVWGSVDDELILTILTDAVDHHAAARTLIERALAAGAPDNATAIVARCRTRATL